MKRALGIALIVLAPSVVSAQSPSVSASASASVSASAPGSALPPGHPPAGHPSIEPGDEVDGTFPKIPQDESRADPAVSTGTIVAAIRDEQDKPVPNTIVTLGIIRTSVAEGEARSRTTATTDAQGIARFSGLKIGSGWAYRASVTANAPDVPDAFATYSSEPVQLPLDGGWSLTIHRFPVTTAFDKMLAAVEGVDTVIELRDDVIEVSQVFDIINASTTTWSLGKGLNLSLPKGFKAVRAAEAMDDHTAVSTEEGVRWAGSFPPGRSRIAYDFKVPYEGEPSFDLDIELPPRVLAARVRTAVKRGMDMTVDGFPPATGETVGSGVKVLSTVRQGSPQDPLRRMSIHVRGIPTPGNDRWLVTAAALTAAAVGFYFARRAPPKSDRTESSAARKRHRKTLLAELVELERGHRAGEVGPKAYARERAKLVDAIADTLDPERPSREPAAT
jgi:hypothetical protein